MVPFEKKFADSIISAEKNLGDAQNITNSILPNTGDSRILIKVLELLHKEAVSLISAILKYEYISKRIELSKEKDKNFEIFFEKCAAIYNLTKSEQDNLKKIIFLGKKHKQSGFEFSHKRKAIILDDNLEMNELTTEQMNEFIILLKKLLFDFRNKISQHY